jgi:hypothetical protein
MMMMVRLVIMGHEYEGGIVLGLNRMGEGEQKRY